MLSPFAVNQANRQAIIDAGAEVRTLTAEERQAWVDAMKPVWEQFSDDVGQDMIDARNPSTRKLN